MNSKLLLFHFVLIVILTISFFIHKRFTDSDFLFEIYIINALAAMAVYNLAYIFRNKHQDYLGYYFLAGTALKFFVFFVYVLPKFKEDGVQTKEEFFSFFVPYIIGLLVETISLLFLV